MAGMPLETLRYQALTDSLTNQALLGAEPAPLSQIDYAPTEPDFVRRFYREGADTTASEQVITTWDWSEAGQNLTQRDNASDILDNQREAPWKLDRAIAISAMDERNLLRAWLTDLKAAFAAATTFADLKARVAALAGLPPRTNAQLRNQIQLRIQDGSGD